MKLYNQDCYQVLKQMPSNSVDLVCTDPPYEIHGLHNSQTFTRPYMTQINPISHGYSKKILKQLIRVMKKINIYIWCSRKQVRGLLNYFANYR